MHIITLVTKRSVRETLKELRYKKCFSREAYSPGDVIEVIDGNKKSPAIILKSEDASDYKQEIRDGSLSINKLRLSKTGTHKNGAVIAHHKPELIKQCLKNPSFAQESKDTLLKDFFPKKKAHKKNTARVSATKDGTLSSLSIDRYKAQVKTHNSELQLFVDEARNYFGEQARYGQGSFSYYLGFCKKIPMTDLWQIFGEAKQTRNKTRFEQKKLFWWKIGQYLKK